MRFVRSVINFCNPIRHPIHTIRMLGSGVQVVEFLLSKSVDRKAYIGFQRYP